MKRAGNGVLIATIVAALMNLGCYDWVAIHPADLPRLNESRETPLGSSLGIDRRGRLVAMDLSTATQTNVRRPDGRTVEIEGDLDARVRTSSGEQREFDAPVVAEVVDGRLGIMSANAAPIVLDMEDIAVLEVSQRNGLKTGLMVLLGAVAVIGSVTVGVIVARQ